MRLGSANKAHNNHQTSVPGNLLPSISFFYIYIIRLGIDEQGQPTRPVSPDHHDQQVRSPPGNEKEEEKCTTMVGFVLTKGQKNG